LAEWKIRNVRPSWDEGPAKASAGKSSRNSAVQMGFEGLSMELGRVEEFTGEVAVATRLIYRKSIRFVRADNLGNCAIFDDLGENVNGRSPW
jgi:hypothetical protein